MWITKSIIVIFFDFSDPLPDPLPNLQGESHSTFERKEENTVDLFYTEYNSEDVYQSMH